MAISLIRFTPQDLHKYKQALIDLLRDAVDGGASVSFIAPMLLSDAEQYWNSVADSVAAQQIILLAALDSNSVIGSVQLAMPSSPNSRHRAEIQKLLVHSSHRRRGIAKALMQDIEREALAINRHLLILDTERGSGAQSLYKQIGYTQAGIIPDFAMSSSGDLRATVFFYKLLE